MSCLLFRGTRSLYEDDGFRIALVDDEQARTRGGLRDLARWSKSNHSPVPEYLQHEARDYALMRSLGLVGPASVGGNSFGSGHPMVFKR